MGYKIKRRVRQSWKYERVTIFTKLQTWAAIAGAIAAIIMLFPGLYAFIRSMAQDFINPTRIISIDASELGTGEGLGNALYPINTSLDDFHGSNEGG